MKPTDIKDKQFGWLTVLELTNERQFRHAVWKCKCICGKYVNVASNSLKCGNPKSCGCLKRKKVTMVGYMQVKEMEETK